jgi:hypothetical protein
MGRNTNERRLGARELSQSGIIQELNARVLNPMGLDLRIDLDSGQLYMIDAGEPLKPRPTNIDKQLAYMDRSMEYAVKRAGQR